MRLQSRIGQLLLAITSQACSPAPEPVPTPILVKEDRAVHITIPTLDTCEIVKTEDVSGCKILTLHCDLSGDQMAGYCQDHPQGEVLNPPDPVIPKDFFAASP